MDNEKQMKILMIVANTSVSPVTGWPVGFWWSELTHAYFIFKDAEFEVEIVSPNGGGVDGDGYSHPEHESMYSSHDFVSLGFQASQEHASLLENTKSIEEINSNDYAGIFVVGGQSPMVTMMDDDRLHKFIVDFYEAGKPIALLCHATAMLLKLKLSNGELLVKDKAWTGFSSTEEEYVESAVGDKIQPFWIEREADKLEENTAFITRPAFRAHCIRDGLLITGQQQNSTVKTANMLIRVVNDVNGKTNIFSGF